MITVLDTWRRKRRAQQTSNALSQLSDHLLTDIGLCRGEVLPGGGVRIIGGDHGWNR
jgi:uncharacterized protein YjiS (DUF1127 family)